MRFDKIFYHFGVAYFLEPPCMHVLQPILQLSEANCRVNKRKPIVRCFLHYITQKAKNSPASPSWLDHTWRVQHRVLAVSHPAELEP